MIYKFKCLDCGNRAVFAFPMREHDKLSKQAYCICGGEVVQLIDAPRAFVKIPFPRGFYHEHVGPKGTILKDKNHFKAVCEENGWTPHHYDGI